MFRLYPRLKAMGNAGYTAEASVVTLHPDRLDIPLELPRGKRIFVCSMSDLFHGDVPYSFIDRAFDIMARCAEERGQTFQILTKRPTNMAHWWETRPKRMAQTLWHPNIWAGVSLELQKYDYRLDQLISLPAAVKYISAEPLLGELELKPWLSTGSIQWVIAGGESGPGARPAKEDWLLSLRDQCLRHNVPFFLKQLGGKKDKRGGEKANLEGTRHTAFPQPTTS